MQIKGWIFMFFCSGWLAVGNLDKSNSKNVTDDHTPRSEILPRIRKSRFLTFNNDESTLRVELNFAVPFLQIPIKGHKAVESGSNNQYPLIDVNAKSLITASALLFMLVFIIPKVIRIFLPHIIANHLPKESRSENKITNLMYDIESAMSALKIDADACWQRTVCFAVQNSAKNVDNKEGTSWDKIIDGVARNDFLHFLADGSSTYQAMRLGLTENECSRMYKSCNFDMKGILSLIKKIPIQSLT